MKVIMQSIKDRILIFALVLFGILLPVYAAQEEVKERSEWPVLVKGQLKAVDLEAIPARIEDIKNISFGELNKQPQLLSVFLDDSEWKIDAEYTSITGTFLNAVCDQAGPIVASRSLLFSLLKGAYASKNKGISDRKSAYVTKNPEIAELFVTLFDGGKDWEIREIDKDLLFMVPRSMLPDAVGEDERDQLLGLRLSFARRVTGDDIAEGAPLYNVNKSSGDVFMTALRENRIFDTRNKSVQWVVYLNGHGGYGRSIATIALQDFSEMLAFFDKKIKVVLFTYSSCYAAGFNAARVYGELTQASYGSVKEYSYPIVTQAVADAVSTGQRVEFYADQLVFKLHFKKFIDYLRDHVSDEPDYYVHAFSYIMPQLKHYLHTADENKQAILNKGDLPHIRFARSPIWVPLVGDAKTVVTVTETMAATRSKPLIIKNYRDEKGEEYKVRAVIFATNYIPFDIVIDKDALAHALIALSGDSMVHVKKIIQRNDEGISAFLRFIGLSFKPGFFESDFYEGKKYVYVDELLIGQDDEFALTYTDVVVDFAHNSLYYTDELGRRFMLDKKGTQLLQDDYRSQFADLFFENKKTKEEQQLKRIDARMMNEKLAREKAIQRGDRESQAKAERNLRVISREKEEVADLLEKKELKKKEALSKNKKIDQLTTDLRKAVLEEDWDKAVECIRQGADVNRPDQYGNTVIMYDVPIDIVRLLLEHGADVNLRGSGGNTPLLYAVSRGADYAILEELIRAGASVLVMNEAGHTVFSDCPDDQECSLSNDALKKEIKQIETRIADYKDLLSRYVELLGVFYNRGVRDSYDMGDIQQLIQKINVFLAWPEHEKKEINTSLQRVQSVVNRVRRMRDFPKPEKHKIEQVYQEMQDIIGALTLKELESRKSDRVDRLNYWFRESDAIVQNLFTRGQAAAQK